MGNRNFDPSEHCFGLIKTGTEVCHSAQLTGGHLQLPVTPALTTWVNYANFPSPKYAADAHKLQASDATKHFETLVKSKR